MKNNNKILWGFLAVSLVLLLLILGQNVYDSIYPPVFFPPKIDVAKVKKRIKDAGLIPREALFYEIIEKNTRLRPTRKESKDGQD